MHPSRALQLILLSMILSGAAIAQATGPQGHSAPTEGKPPATGKPASVPMVRLQPAMARIQVAGAQTVRPILDQAAKKFRRLHPDVSFVLAGNGTANGLQAVSAGTTNIGMVSYHVREEELAGQDLVVTPIATDGIVFVTHLSNPVTNLSSQQAVDILSGRIRHWRVLGGPDAPVEICAPDNMQGTLITVAEHFDLTVDRHKSGREQITLLQRREARDLERGSVRILDGNRALLAAVMTQPNAIGIVSAGAAEGIQNRGAAIRLLTLDGIEATQENIRTGTYPLRRPLSLVTSSKPGAKVAEFMRFVQGPEGHQILRSLSFVPIETRPRSPTPERQDGSGQPASAARPGDGR